MASQQGGEAAKGLAGAQPAPQPASEPALGPPQPGQAERGTPSQQLAQAQAERGDTVLDTSGGGYETITDAASESGIYNIVGGYLDEDRVVHNEVHVRSLSGDEEELISNDGIDILDRLTGLMTACTERIGTITDKGKITQAIHRLPTGSRTHLLICLRRVTHWKRHKDIYEMDVRCPIEDCQEVRSYKVDLGDIEVFEMSEPDKRDFTVRLLDCEDEVMWRVATLPQERVFKAVRTSKADEHRILSVSSMARMVSINGTDVRLGVEDFIHNKKLKLSKKAVALYDVVRKWTSGDRDQMREDFFLNEPGVETELIFECEACKREFRGNLDVTQRTFFFPSATSRRSKPKSSI